MRNVEPGFRVVGSDGHEIGTVANCAREYCEVNTGILGLGHPLYVPMDAVSQTEGNTVFLNVPSDRISQLNWSQPPPGATEACPAGYHGTMPAQAATRTPASEAPTPPSVNELTPSALESVQTGWPVICAEGKQVGTVATGKPNGIEMERGWFIFRHKVFVPATAVARIDQTEHKVYLAATCAEVNRFRSV